METEYEKKYKKILKPSKKRYFSLQKGNFFSSVFYFFRVACKHFWQFATVFIPIISSIGMFLVFYLIEDEKNDGTKLILTTFYTRKELVVSRYFLCCLITLIQSILYLFFSLANPVFQNSISKTVFLVIFICVSFTCILLPFSFILSSKFFALAMMPIYLLFGYLESFTGILREQVSFFMMFILFILLMVVICGSIAVSKAVYQTKDL